MSRVSHANIANSRWMIPNLVSHLVPSDGTKGEIALLEIVVRSGGELPGRTHQREDQFFYVLEGNFIFDVGDSQVVSKEGSVVWIPKGVEHGFRVYQETGRVLQVLLPGGFERWMFDVSSPAEFLNLPPKILPGYLLNLEGMARATSDYQVVFGASTSEVSPAESFACHRHERNNLHFGPLTVSLLASSNQTKGALAVMAVELEPEASSPLYEKSELELVYILHGQARYQIYETLIEVGAGTALLISRGAKSGYRNVGPDPLSTIHLLCGGNADRVLSEALPHYGDVEAIAKVMGRHGWNWISHQIGD